MKLPAKLKNKVLQGTFWYSIVGLLNGSLNLLLLPILTRWLDTDEFGLLNTVLAISAIIMPIVTAGFGAGVIRYYHEYREEPERYRKFFSVAFWCQFIVVIVLSLTVLVLFGSGWVDSIVGVDVVYLIPIMIVVVLVPIRDLGNQLLTTQEQHKKASVNQFVAFIAALVFSLLFMGVYEWGVLGRLYGLVCGAVVAALMLIRLPELRSMLIFSFDNAEFKTALKFGLPYLPYGLAVALMMQIDKLIVQKYLDLSDVGIYSAAKSLSLGLSCIFLAITRAWYPRYFVLRDGNQEAKVMQGQWCILCVLLVTVIGFVILAPVVFPVVVNERYLSGTPLLPIFGMGAYCYGLFMTQANYITYLKKTSYLPMIAIIGVAVNVALAFYLIPQIGSAAAAWSTMAGYLVMVIFISCVNAKLEGRVLERMGLPILSIILAITGSLLCSQIPIEWGWISRIFLSVLSCVLVYVLWVGVQGALNKRYSMLELES